MSTDNSSDSSAHSPKKRKKKRGSETWSENLSRGSSVSSTTFVEPTLSSESSELSIKKRKRQKSSESEEDSEKSDFLETMSSETCSSDTSRAESSISHSTRDRGRKRRSKNKLETTDSFRTKPSETDISIVSEFSMTSESSALSSKGSKRKKSCRSSENSSEVHSEKSDSRLSEVGMSMEINFSENENETSSFDVKVKGFESVNTGKAGETAPGMIFENNIEKMPNISKQVGKTSQEEGKASQEDEIPKRSSIEKFKSKISGLFDKRKDALPSDSVPKEGSHEGILRKVSDLFKRSNSTQQSKDQSSQIHSISMGKFDDAMIENSYKSNNSLMKPVKKRHHSKRKKEKEHGEELHHEQSLEEREPDVIVRKKVCHEKKFIDSPTEELYQKDSFEKVPDMQHNESTSIQNSKIHSWNLSEKSQELHHSKYDATVRKKSSEIIKWNTSELKSASETKTEFNLNRLRDKFKALEESYKPVEKQFCVAVKGKNSINIKDSTFESNAFSEMKRQDFTKWDTEKELEDDEALKQNVEPFKSETCIAVKVKTSKLDIYYDDSEDTSSEAESNFTFSKKSAENNTDDKCFVKRKGKKEHYEVFEEKPGTAKLSEKVDEDFFVESYDTHSEFSFNDEKKNFSVSFEEQQTGLFDRVCKKSFEWSVKEKSTDEMLVKEKNKCHAEKDKKFHQKEKPVLRKYSEEVDEIFASQKVKKKSEEDVMKDHSDLLKAKEPGLRASSEKVNESNVSDLARTKYYEDVMKEDVKEEKSGLKESSEEVDKGKPDMSLKEKKDPHQLFPESMKEKFMKNLKSFKTKRQAERNLSSPLKSGVDVTNFSEMATQAFFSEMQKAQDIIDSSSSDGDSPPKRSIKRKASSSSVVSKSRMRNRLGSISFSKISNIQHKEKPIRRRLSCPRTRKTISTALSKHNSASDITRLNLQSKRNLEGVTLASSQDNSNQCMSHSTTQRKTKVQDMSLQKGDIKSEDTISALSWDKKCKEKGELELPLNKKDNQYQLNSESLKEKFDKPLNQYNIQKQPLKALPLSLKHTETEQEGSSKKLSNIAPDGTNLSQSAPQKRHAFISAMQKTQEILELLSSSSSDDDSPPKRSIKRKASSSSFASGSSMRNRSRSNSLTRSSSKFQHEDKPPRTPRRFSCPRTIQFTNIISTPVSKPDTSSDAAFGASLLSTKLRYPKISEHVTAPLSQDNSKQCMSQSGTQRKTELQDTLLQKSDIKSEGATSEDKKCKERGEVELRLNKKDNQYQLNSESLKEKFEKCDKPLNKQPLKALPLSLKHTKTEQEGSSKKLSNIAPNLSKSAAQKRHAFISVMQKTQEILELLSSSSSDDDSPPKRSIKRKASSSSLASGSSMRNRSRSISLTRSSSKFQHEDKPPRTPRRFSCPRTIQFTNIISTPVSKPETSSDAAFGASLLSTKLKHPKIFTAPLSQDNSKQPMSQSGTKSETAVRDASSQKRVIKPEYFASTLSRGSSKLSTPQSGTERGTKVSSNKGNIKLEGMTSLLKGQPRDTSSANKIQGSDGAVSGKALSRPHILSRMSSPRMRPKEPFRPQVEKMTSYESNTESESDTEVESKIDSHSSLRLKSEGGAITNETKLKQAKTQDASKANALQKGDTKPKSMASLQVERQASGTSNADKQSYTKPLFQRRLSCPPMKSTLQISRMASSGSDTESENEKIAAHPSLQVRHTEKVTLPSYASSPNNFKSHNIIVQNVSKALKTGGTKLKSMSSLQVEGQASNTRGMEELQGSTGSRLPKKLSCPPTKPSLQVSKMVSSGSETESEKESAAHPRLQVRNTVISEGVTLRNYASSPDNFKSRIIVQDVSKASGVNGLHGSTGSHLQKSHTCPPMKSSLQVSQMASSESDTESDRESAARPSSQVALPFSPDNSKSPIIVQDASKANDTLQAGDIKPKSMASLGVKGQARGIEELQGRTGSHLQRSLTCPPMKYSLQINNMTSSESDTEPDKEIADHSSLQARHSVSNTSEGVTSGSRMEKTEMQDASKWKNGDTKLKDSASLEVGGQASGREPSSRSHNHKIRNANSAQLQGCVSTTSCEVDSLSSVDERTELSFPRKSTARKRRYHQKSTGAQFQRKLSYPGAYSHRRLSFPQESTKARSRRRFSCPHESTVAHSQRRLGSRFQRKYSYPGAYSHRRLQENTKAHLRRRLSCPQECSRAHSRRRLSCSQKSTRAFSRYRRLSCPETFSCRRLSCPRAFSRRRLSLPFWLSYLHKLLIQSNQDTAESSAESESEIRSVQARHTETSKRVVLPEYVSSPDSLQECVSQSGRVMKQVKMQDASQQLDKASLTKKSNTVPSRKRLSHSSLTFTQMGDDKSKGMDLLEVGWESSGTPSYRRRSDPSMNSRQMKNLLKANDALRKGDVQPKSTTLLGVERQAGSTDEPNKSCIKVQDASKANENLLAGDAQLKGLVSCDAEREVSGTSGVHKSQESTGLLSQRSPPMKSSPQASNATSLESDNDKKSLQEQHTVIPEGISLPKDASSPDNIKKSKSQSKRKQKKNTLQDTPEVTIALQTSNNQSMHIKISKSGTEELRKGTKPRSQSSPPMKSTLQVNKATIPKRKTKSKKKSTSQQSLQAGHTTSESVASTTSQDNSKPSKSKSKSKTKSQDTSKVAVALVSSNTELGSLKVETKVSGTGGVEDDTMAKTDTKRRHQAGSEKRAQKKKSKSHYKIECQSVAPERRAKSDTVIEKNTDAQSPKKDTSPGRRTKIDTSPERCAKSDTVIEESTDAHSPKKDTLPERRTKRDTLPERRAKSDTIIEKSTDAQSSKTNTSPKKRVKIDERHAKSNTVIEKNTDAQNPKKGTSEQHSSSRKQKSRSKEKKSTPAEASKTTTTRIDISFSLPEKCTCSIKEARSDNIVSESKTDASQHHAARKSKSRSKSKPEVRVVADKVASKDDSKKQRRKEKRSVHGAKSDIVSKTRTDTLSSPQELATDEKAKKAVSDEVSKTPSGSRKGSRKLVAGIRDTKGDVDSTTKTDAPSPPQKLATDDKAKKVVTDEVSKTPSGSRKGSKKLVAGIRDTKGDVDFTTKIDAPSSPQKLTTNDKAKKVVTDEVTPSGSCKGSKKLAAGIHDAKGDIDFTTITDAPNSLQKLAIDDKSEKVVTDEVFKAPSGSCKGSKQLVAGICDAKGDVDFTIRTYAPSSSQKLATDDKAEKVVTDEVSKTPSGSSKDSKERAAGMQDAKGDVDFTTKTDAPSSPQKLATDDKAEKVVTDEVSKTPSGSRSKILAAGIHDGKGGVNFTTKTDAPSSPQKLTTNDKAKKVVTDEVSKTPSGSCKGSKKSAAGIHDAKGDIDFTTITDAPSSLQKLVIDDKSEKVVTDEVFKAPSGSCKGSKQLVAGICDAKGDVDFTIRTYAPSSSQKLATDDKAEKVVTDEVSKTPSGSSKDSKERAAGMQDAKGDVDFTTKTDAPSSPQKLATDDKAEKVVTDEVSKTPSGSRKGSKKLAAGIHDGKGGVNFTTKTDAPSSSQKLTTNDKAKKVVTDKVSKTPSGSCKGSKKLAAGIHDAKGDVDFTTITDAPRLAIDDKSEKVVTDEVSNTPRGSSKDSKEHAAGMRDAKIDVAFTTKTDAPSSSQKLATDDKAEKIVTDEVSKPASGSSKGSKELVAGAKGDVDFTTTPSSSQKLATNNKPEKVDTDKVSDTLSGSCKGSKELAAGIRDAKGDVDLREKTEVQTVAEDTSHECSSSSGTMSQSTRKQKLAEASNVSKVSEGTAQKRGASIEKTKAQIVAEDISHEYSSSLTSGTMSQSTRKQEIAEASDVSEVTAQKRGASIEKTEAQIEEEDTSHEYSLSLTSGTTSQSTRKWEKAHSEVSEGTAQKRGASIVSIRQAAIKDINPDIKVDAALFQSSLPKIGAPKSTSKARRKLNRVTKVKSSDTYDTPKRATKKQRALSALSFSERQTAGATSQQPVLSETPATSHTSKFKGGVVTADTNDIDGNPNHTTKKDTNLCGTKEGTTSISDAKSHQQTACTPQTSAAKSMSQSRSKLKRAAKSEATCISDTPAKEDKTSFVSKGYATDIDIKTDSLSDLKDSLQQLPLTQRNLKMFMLQTRKKLNEAGASDKEDATIKCKASFEENLALSQTNVTKSTSPSKEVDDTPNSTAKQCRASLVPEECGSSIHDSKSEIKSEEKTDNQSHEENLQQFSQALTDLKNQPRKKQKKALADDASKIATQKCRASLERQERTTTIHGASNSDAKIDAPIGHVEGNSQQLALSQASMMESTPKCTSKLKKMATLEVPDIDDILASQFSSQSRSELEKVVILDVSDVDDISDSSSQERKDSLASHDKSALDSLDSEAKIDVENHVESTLQQPALSQTSITESLLQSKSKLQGVEPSYINGIPEKASQKHSASFASETNAGSIDTDSETQIKDQSYVEGNSQQLALSQASTTEFSSQSRSELEKVMILDLSDTLDSSRRGSLASQERRGSLASQERRGSLASQERRGSLASQERRDSLASHDKSVLDSLDSEVKINVESHVENTSQQPALPQTSITESSSQSSKLEKVAINDTSDSASQKLRASLVPQVHATSIRDDKGVFDSEAKINEKSHAEGIPQTSVTEFSSQSKNELENLLVILDVSDKDDTSDCSSQEHKASQEHATSIHDDEGVFKAIINGQSHVEGPSQPQTSITESSSQSRSKLEEVEPSYTSDTPERAIKKRRVSFASDTNADSIDIDFETKTDDKSLEEGNSQTSETKSMLQSGSKAERIVEAEGSDKDKTSLVPEEHATSKRAVASDVDSGTKTDAPSHVENTLQHDALSPTIATKSTSQSISKVEEVQPTEENAINIHDAKSDTDSEVVKTDGQHQLALSQTCETNFMPRSTSEAERILVSDRDDTTSDSATHKCEDSFVLQEHGISMRDARSDIDSGTVTDAQSHAGDTARQGAPSPTSITKSEIVAIEVSDMDATPDHDITKKETLHVTDTTAGRKMDEKEEKEKVS